MSFSNQNFGFPYYSPPPPQFFPYTPNVAPPHKPSVPPPSAPFAPPPHVVPKPPTPATASSPPSPIVKPPPQPVHPVLPPSPSVKPPPRPVNPPPRPINPPSPHLIPPPSPPHSIPPPAPTPSGNHTTIIVVFVSLGGLFFLAFLAVALCCCIQKKKKKMVQKTEIIDVDEHMKIQEVIVPGPHGTQSVALNIEEDVHIHEQIKKNETVGEGLHAKSLPSDASGAAETITLAERSSHDPETGASSSDSNHQLLEHKS